MRSISEIDDSDSGSSEGQHSSQVKVCRRCHQEKCVLEFDKCRRNADGLQSYCKVCTREYGRDWQAKHRERLSKKASERYWADPEAAKRVTTDWSLRQMYGITLEEKLAMLAAQGGVCALCRQARSKRWHLDHNHLTGKRRGILCSQCNSLLGMAADDLGILQAAIEYLKVWS
jgi:hypothetical protein